ncbi:MAG: TSUP family transporter [Rubrobacter sp.]
MYEISLEVVFILLAASAAFTLSAAAGLGGSLILVPALALVLGPKEGVALAALLLALNNVVKVFAYRRSIPLAKSALVIVLTIAGSAIGASLLVVAPESMVSVAVVGCIALTMLGERFNLGSRARGVATPTLAFASGATSGFSGTSGPLKGIALRNLRLDRFHMAGAASAVSLAGDLTKTAVFTDAGLLGPESLTVAGLCAPLMLVATFTGRTLNRTVAERGYAFLFWAVMCGYSVRLLVT